MLRKAEETFGNGGADDDDATARDPAQLNLGSQDPALQLFATIVGLRTGEALVFAADAVLRVKNGASKIGRAAAEIKKLGYGILRVRVRQRVTEDGGKSIMAT